MSACKQKNATQVQALKIVCGWLGYYEPLLQVWYAYWAPEICPDTTGMVVHIPDIHRSQSKGLNDSFLL